MLRSAASRSNRIAPCLFLVIVLALAGPFTPAATGYEDLDGRFRMDIPEDWVLAPQTDPNVFVFTQGTQSFLAYFVPDARTIDEVIAFASTTMQSAGLTAFSPRGDTESLMIGGHQASRGTYTGTFSSGRQSIELHTRIGAILLEEGGFSLVVLAAPSSIAPLATVLDRVLETVREIDEIEAPTSRAEIVASETPASPPLSPPIPSELHFVGERVSMDLPSGWYERPRAANFEKVVVGFFGAHHLGDASLIVTCESKMGLNAAKLVKAGKITVEAAIPGAQPVRVYEQEGESRRDTISVVIYEGVGTANGMEVPVCAVTASLKAEECWVNLISIGGRPHEAALEKDTLQVARSIR